MHTYTHTHYLPTTTMTIGADLTDYFNYGFSEETWRLYCDKQRKMRSEVMQLNKIAVSFLPVPLLLPRQCQHCCKGRSLRYLLPLCSTTTTDLDSSSSSSGGRELAGLVSALLLNACFACYLTCCFDQNFRLTAVVLIILFMGMVGSIMHIRSEASCGSETVCTCMHVHVRVCACVRVCVE